MDICCQFPEKKKKREKRKKKKKKARHFYDFNLSVTKRPSSATESQPHARNAQTTAPERKKNVEKYNTRQVKRSLDGI